MTYISAIIIPLIVFYIVANGLVKKQPVYNDFIEGAKKGIVIVKDLIPTLIGLMLGVAVLRASGFLNWLSDIIAYIIPKTFVPGEIVGLVISKLFSSSAATGILIDIYKTNGADSSMGLMASLILCSTENVFYTMSVYFLSVKITNSRWTLKGGLLATFAGVVASVLMVNFGLV